MSEANPTNYDASDVGVKYVRAHKLTIHYPEKGTGLPWATIEQSLAVNLRDGTAARVGDLPFIQTSFDLVDDGNTPIPLVSPETGLPIEVEGQPAFTTLNQVMLGLLAVVRREQLAVG